MNKNQVDFKNLLGTWHNTQPETKGIASFEIYSQNGVPTFRAFGSKTSEVIGDWGEIQFIPLAGSLENNAAKAFHITYELESGKSLLAVNENKGLLIIAGYFFPKDGEPYFYREFFYRE